jgi:hypothetical protein
MIGSNLVRNLVQPHRRIFDSRLGNDAERALHDEQVFLPSHLIPESSPDQLCRAELHIPERIYGQSCLQDQTWKRIFGWNMINSNAFFCPQRCRTTQDRRQVVSQTWPSILTDKNLHCDRIGCIQISSGRTVCEVSNGAVRRGIGNGRRMTDQFLSYSRPHYLTDLPFSRFPGLQYIHSQNTGMYR